MAEMDWVLSAAGMAMRQAAAMAVAASFGAALLLTAAWAMAALMGRKKCRRRQH